MSKLPLLLVFVLTGCAGPTLPPLTPSHPASPDAPEASLRLPAQTLPLPDGDGETAEHHGH